MGYMRTPASHRNRRGMSSLTNVLPNTDGDVPRKCLGGPSLATICMLFCEDYVGRCSGAPDLIVWNYAKRICKFVEVKSANDKLSDSQKVGHSGVSFVQMLTKIPPALAPLTLSRWYPC
jgi:hypothetical protein